MHVFSELFAQLTFDWHMAKLQKPKKESVSLSVLFVDHVACFNLIVCVLCICTVRAVLKVHS